MSDDTKDAFAKRIICRPNEDILRFTRIEGLIKQALKHQPTQPVEAGELSGWPLNVVVSTEAVRLKRWCRSVRSTVNAHKFF